MIRGWVDEQRAVMVIARRGASEPWASGFPDLEDQKLFLLGGVFIVSGAGFLRSLVPHQHHQKPYSRELFEESKGNV